MVPGPVDRDVIREGGASQAKGRQNAAKRSLVERTSPSVFSSRGCSLTPAPSLSGRPEWEGAEVTHSLVAERETGLLAPDFSNKLS